MKTNRLTASLILGVSSLAYTAYAQTGPCGSFKGELDGNTCVLSEQGANNLVNDLNDLFLQGKIESSSLLHISSDLPDNRTLDIVANKGSLDRDHDINDSYGLIFNPTTALEFGNNASFDINATASAKFEIGGTANFGVAEELGVHSVYITGNGNKGDVLFNMDLNILHDGILHLNMREQAIFDANIVNLNSDVNLYDMYSIEYSTLRGTIKTGAGNDNFVFTESSIEGEIYTSPLEGTYIKGSEFEQFYFQDSNYSGKIYSGIGGDFVDLRDTLSTAESIIDTGADDDFMYVDNKSSVGIVNMGTGSDTLLLSGNDITLLNTLDGGDDYSLADGWDDTLTFEDWQKEWPGVDLLNWENITLKNSVMDAAEPLNLAAGNLNIEASSTLNIPQGMELTGNLNNQGLVNVSNGVAGDAYLDIAGDYNGSGNVILDLDLAAEKSDVVKIGGNVNDVMNIGFNPVGTDHNGGGLDGILVIDAPKAENSNFNFGGKVADSAFAWYLEPRGDEFYLNYLTSTPPVIEPPVVEPPVVEAQLPPEPEEKTVAPKVFLPEFAGYAALPLIGKEITSSQIGTLHDRLGELRRHDSWIGEGPHSITSHIGTGWGNIYSYIPKDKNIWAKAIMGQSQLDSGETYGFEGNYGGIDAGIDYQYTKDRHNVYYGGLFFGYRNGSYTSDGHTDTATAFAETNIDVDSYSFGAYGTFFINNKSYIDLVGKYSLLNGNVSYDETKINETTSLSGFSRDVDGHAINLSAEFGHRIDLNEGLIVEPQAQLTYANISWDDIKENNAYDVSFDDGNFVTARLALRLEKTYQLSNDAELKPWIRTGVLQEFGDSSLSVKDGSGNHDIENYDIETYAQVDLGLTYKAKDNLQFYGSVNYRDDFNQYKSFEGAVGLRLSW